MPTFLVGLLRAGLKSALSAALAGLLVDAEKDPGAVLTDDEVAKMTPQQYGDAMAEDLLQRMGFPGA